MHVSLRLYSCCVKILQFLLLLFPPTCYIMLSEKKTPVMFLVISSVLLNHLKKLHKECKSPLMKLHNSSVCGVLANKTPFSLIICIMQLGNMPYQLVMKCVWYKTYIYGKILIPKKRHYIYIIKQKVKYHADVKDANRMYIGL